MMAPMVILAAHAGYRAEAWESFAVAEVGAAAALAGLLVVAASINIARIVELPAIVKRLGATLALFTGILIVGSLLLVPDQDHRLLGAEIAVLGVALATVVYSRRGHQTTEPEYRRRALVVAGLGVLAALLIAIGGVGYATASIGGLYWLVPGVLLGFSIGLVNAWVAMVEILR